MSIALVPIGQGPDDLRFFIQADGIHAGGITVHSAKGEAFSYGIAIAPAMRRRGVASAALSLLFAQMRKAGYARAFVQVAPQNAASLALHRKLGFVQTTEDAYAVTLVKVLSSGSSQQTKMTSLQP